MLHRNPHNVRRRLLDPMDRVSEILFGLIMVLTFTGSLSAAQAGRGEVREMLVGALGCNLAWGIIDGVMYLMACLADRGRNRHGLRAVRDAATAEDAHRAITDSMPDAMAEVLQEPELEEMRQRLIRLPDASMQVRLTRDDWLGALGVCLLVFFSVFPVVVPFIFLHDTMLALRMSDGIALAMLFGTGFAFGRCTGHRPWAMGLSMAVLGSALVGITMALGG
jgi:hypothetical protein